MQIWRNIVHPKLLSSIFNIFILEFEYAFKFTLDNIKYIFINVNFR